MTDGLPPATEEPVKPGDYAWGVDCKRCAAFIGFVRDASGGKSQIKWTGPGSLKTKCGHCALTAKYKTKQVYRRQIPFDS